jgi:UDPglucose 6-dehydrogenase
VEESVKRICIIGTGYVGLVTGACLAHLGHRVACVDTDVEKVAALQRGQMPIYEPDLEPMVLQNMAAGRLSVTSSFTESVPKSDFVFVCVGTPSGESGAVDLSYLRLAYMKIRAALNGSHPIIVNKSTVPPGTSDEMAALLASASNGRSAPRVVSNPEFLREGHAVADFMHPHRVVVGAADPEDARRVAKLYESLECPILLTDPSTAEMIKVASNAFLAMKVSFVNEMASICEKIGIDIKDVSHGLGLDPRIGRWYLRAGPGFGGSCLPKDTSLLSHFAAAQGCSPALLNAVIEVNQQQPQRLTDLLSQMLGGLQGTRIAILGLAFKADTGDARNSPAVALLETLRAGGAQIKAYDPKAMANARRIAPYAEYAEDAYQCAQGCDAVVVATEWPEFAELDLRRLRAGMRGSVMLDTRHMVDPNLAQEAGLSYQGVGRGQRTSAQPLVLLEERSGMPALLD